MGFTLKTGEEDEDEDDEDFFFFFSEELEEDFFFFSFLTFFSGVLDFELEEDFFLGFLTFLIFFSGVLDFELELELLLLFSFILGILIDLGCFNYLRGFSSTGGAKGAISGTLSWIETLDELLLLLEDFLELELLFTSVFSWKSTNLYVPVWMLSTYFCETELELLDDLFLACFFFFFLGGVLLLLEELEDDDELFGFFFLGFFFLGGVEISLEELDGDTLFAFFFLGIVELALEKSTDDTLICFFSFGGALMTVTGRTGGLSDLKRLGAYFGEEFKTRLLLSECTSSTRA